jgi:membrane-associated phospholipid phosphatase
MSGFERLALGYFAALALAAPFTGAAAPAVRRALLLCAAAAGAVVLASNTLGSDARAWLGHAYLAVGYWAPGLLAPARAPTRFESWLARTDARWRSRLPAPPRWIERPAALSYLSCYLLVPAGFLVAWMAGPAPVNRYWLSVLAAALGCYAWLPWLTSRPPRALDPTPPDSTLDRANTRVLRTFSHGWNTFPSGHAAVALVVALNAAPLSPLAGAVLAVLAAGVALGAVTGRHHYAPDVAAGLAFGGAVGAAALLF